MLMKTFTVILASAMMLGGLNAQAQGTAKHKRVQGTFFSQPQNSLVLKSSLVKNSAKGLTPARLASAKAQYLPKQETLYEYDGEGWNKMGEYTYTYDANGNITSTKEVSEDGVTLTEKTLSDDGLLSTEINKVSEDGGQSYVNTTKLVQRYDPIVTGLVVEKLRYTWNEDAGDWEATTDAFRRDIKRDAEKNIVGLTVSVPYDGSYDAIQRYTNTVDPVTKQIATYKFEELGYDDNNEPQWQTSEYLTNLKWKETKGQLVSQYDEWMQWGNMLLSGNLSYEENGETLDFGSISVEYTDDGGYKEVFEYTDELERTTTTKTIDDANGSYTMEQKTLEDLNGDMVLTEDEVSDWFKEVLKYDSRKNLVEDEVFMLDDDGVALVKFGGNRNEYTYDSEHGDALRETVTSEYDMDAQEYMPATKIVVDSYYDMTDGINTVDKDSVTATSVYNLQGMKVSASELAGGRGLYIVKKGNKTVKVVK